MEECYFSKVVGFRHERVNPNILYTLEAIPQKCSVKKVFLNISQNSQEIQLY